MLVPTVKSPHERLRARVVICGNHLTKVNEDNDNSAGEMKSKGQAPYSLYAGGADGTMLRCLMRCAAQKSWSIGTVDIKTAFLLAPRPDEQERLLVARPPKVLIEAGICPPTELGFQTAIPNIPATTALSLEQTDWCSSFCPIPEDTRAPKK